LVAFIVVLGGLLLFNAGASILDRYDDNIPLNGMVYGGVVSLWFLVFVFRSIYLISQYWFNAVDGHPYLQPLMTVWMAWVLAINTLAFQSGGESGVPASIAATLPILAGSVTTALALAEAARVRNTLRPAPTSRPA
jgi:hypothetical protein